MSDKTAEEREELRKRMLQFSHHKPKPKIHMSEYTDSNNPDFKVGLKCYGLADCARHFSRNFQHLRDELEKTLGLVPQWKKEMQAAGTFVQMNDYVADTEPEAWVIERIRTMPTGYTMLTMKRGSTSLQVQNDSFADAYCIDVDAYIKERMEPTREKMLTTAKMEADRKASENKAQREIDLQKARALLNRDSEMRSFQRDAMHKDRSYAASIKAASDLINSQSAKPARKTAQAASVQANKRIYAQGCVKSAEKTVASRKKILKIRTEMGKQAKIDEAQRDLDEAEAKLMTAKESLFQC